MAACLLVTACNDDFMQQDPLMDLTESTSLRSEIEFEYYLNQFYSRYMPGHYNGWGDSRTAPFYDFAGSPIMFGDAFSDNMVVTGTVSNTSGNASARLNGSWRTPASGTNEGWDWVGLRQLNYFLRNYKQAEGSVSDPSQLNKWVAEAYFFKAWDYYRKVMIFGDVPWLSYDLNTESPELQAPRTPRAVVMDSVLNMINYAVAHIQDNGRNPIGRINKDQANFLKARICLFEGTFRKYHTELGLQGTANAWLQECVNACEAIVATGRYDLYTANTHGYGSYWELFTKKGLDGANHPEAIRARVYDGSTGVKGHSTQRYYEQNNFNRAGRGMAKYAMDEYLCADGLPIGESLLFQGYDGMWSEMENRDPRLCQTVARPGSFQTISPSGSGVMDIARYGIIYPNITYSATSSRHSTVSGYAIAKHFMADKAEYDAGAAQTGTQTALIFRYGELLLMLAEAKAELGTIDDTDLDRTINKLRERAGFDFGTYPNAKLTMSNIPADPRLDAIYAEKLGAALPPIIREIRRERRVEMFAEGLRYEDLMRWKAGNLLTVPMRGMKMTPDKIALYATTKSFNPANPLSLTNCTVSYICRPGTEVYVDADGFIVANPLDANLGIGVGILPWSDHRYYWPIPLDQLTLNPNLKQNQGWEGIN